MSVAVAVNAWMANLTLTAWEESRADRLRRFILEDDRWSDFGKILELSKVRSLTIIQEKGIMPVSWPLLMPLMPSIDPCPSRALLETIKEISRLLHLCILQQYRRSCSCFHRLP